MASNWNAESIKKTLSDFIVSNYLFGDEKRRPADGDSLIEGGIMDSTGILELIEFVESTFGIQVKETETVPQNLDGLANLTAFISKKLQG